MRVSFHESAVLSKIHNPINEWLHCAEPQQLESDEHRRSFPDYESSKKRIMNENILKLILEEVALARTRLPNRYIQKDHILGDNEFKTN
jgi:hypothetical protein